MVQLNVLTGGSRVHSSPLRVSCCQAEYWYPLLLLLLGQAVRSVPLCVCAASPGPSRFRRKGKDLHQSADEHLPVDLEHKRHPGHRRNTHTDRFLHITWPPASLDTVKHQNLKEDSRPRRKKTSLNLPLDLKKICKKNNKTSEFSLNRGHICSSVANIIYSHTWPLKVTSGGAQGPKKRKKNSFSSLHFKIITWYLCFGWMVGDFHHDAWPRPFFLASLLLCVHPARASVSESADHLPSCTSSAQHIREGCLCSFIFHMNVSRGMRFFPLWTVNWSVTHTLGRRSCGISRSRQAGSAARSLAAWEIRLNLLSGLCASWFKVI